MIDFHVRLFHGSGSGPCFMGNQGASLGGFSLEAALFYGKKAHLRTLGLLVSDICLQAEQVKELEEKALELALFYDLNVYLGFCLENIPPALIPKYTMKARDKGYTYVALSGEAITKDFLPGTNLAGVEAGIDLLLHPGHIDPILASYIKEKNIFVEFNTHPYYSHGNPLLAKYAMDLDIPLVWGSSLSSPGDFSYLPLRGFFPQICPQIDPKDLIKKINEDTLSFINHLKA